jgi:hypothetical protein
MKHSDVVSMPKNNKNLCIYRMSLRMIYEQVLDLQRVYFKQNKINTATIFKY